MGKMRMPVLLIMVTLLFNFIQGFSQNTQPSKVEFKNAPVLFREEGKAYQQIIANYKTDTPGKILFTSGGKELLKADLVKGNNRFLLKVRAVNKAKKITVAAKIDNRAAEKYPVTLVPPQKMADLLCSAFSYRYRLYPSSVGDTGRAYALY